MGPDNFSTPGNNRPINPNRPPQRQFQDFSPRPRPAQRPVNNLAPRPQQQPQNYPHSQLQPQFAPQRPASMPNPQPQMQRPHAVTQPPIQQNTPQTPLTFEPPKKKKRFSLVHKIALSTAVIILVAVGSFAFMNFGKKTNDQVAKANTQPAIKALEKPDFTTYYPSTMPAGLTISKGTITYYKDSFTFIIEQGGQKTFFVYEQPASTDPDFSSLKSKLAAPKDIALTVGPGVEGGLDNGTVTAVKTDKNTIIIISCTKIVCSTAPRDILSSMQVSNELEKIREDNS